MPNWCSCELTVQVTAKGHPGKRRKQTEMLERFVDFAKGTEDELEANNFWPIPKELEDGNGWYDWCIHNWGTKWGFCHTSEAKWLSKTKILYSFDTAWSPPTGLLLHISEMYPEFTFKLKYWEGGCGFKGVYTVKNGIVIEDEHSEYRGMRGG